MLTVLADCSRLSDNRVVAGRVRSNFSQICPSRKTNSVGEAGLWVVLARGTEDGRPSLERSRQRVQNLSENFDLSFSYQQHTAQHSTAITGLACVTETLTHAMREASCRACRCLRKR